MESFDALLEDPIIQLLMFVILFVCVMDAFKFALLWVYKMLGRKEGDE